MPEFVVERMGRGKPERVERVQAPDLRVGLVGTDVESGGKMPTKKIAFEQMCKAVTVWCGRSDNEHVRHEAGGRWSKHEQGI